MDESGVSQSCETPVGDTPVRSNHAGSSVSMEWVVATDSSMRSPGCTTSESPPTYWLRIATWSPLGEKASATAR